MQYIGYILVLIHGFLLIWSVGGIVEMVFARVPWKPFTNLAFPFWVLVIHWGSVLFAATTFLYGYFAQWSKTPQTMAFAYSLMMLVCIIETFGYMTSKTKYIAMGAEFLAYAIILFLLFKSRYFVTYFSKP